MLSDNGASYRSLARRDACAELRVTHRRTRPSRPQTSGRIGRFHQTLAADSSVYAQFYDSDAQRRATLPAGLHFYNRARTPRAAGHQSPD